MTSLFVEDHQIVSGFVPVNLATAANDGDWVSLKNYGKCTIIFFKAGGTAGDDPTLTLEQATDVSGTGAKALNFTKLHVKQESDLAAGGGTFTAITDQTDDTYTEATSAEDEAIWVAEVDAEDLDADNDFDCLRARVADVGTNSQIGCCLYILGDPRYPQETNLSAIAD